MARPSRCAPAFVRLAGHPVRWQLLTALAHGDLRVRELVELAGRPQTLVSYHLRLLRDGGLVTAVRSTSDGRDSYYHLDLDRCADGLADAGAALHPALAPRTPAVRRAGLATLFVCTGNSARSPVAEALLRRHAAGHVTVTSAGTSPRPRLHPHAVRVLRDRFGIDVAGQRPRPVEAILGRRFDYVITLCDKAREASPEFAGDPYRLHWSVPDPGAAGYPAFTRMAADIDTRIRHLLPVLGITDQKEAAP
jgi:protein-tyrosine-phosphatase/DNA-binding transcriptional ArsR family regulator